MSTQPEAQSAEEYNYPDFVMSREMPAFQAFPDHLRAGQRAPDAELVRLDDMAKVKLSDYWRDGPVVTEFGSFT